MLSAGSHAKRRQKQKTLPKLQTASEHFSSTVKPQSRFMRLTLVAGGPGRVEVSQLLLYILQHPERILILR